MPRCRPLGLLLIMVSCSGTSPSREVPTPTEPLPSAFEECVWVSGVGRYDAFAGGKLEGAPACGFDALGPDGFLYGRDGDDVVRWDAATCTQRELLVRVEAPKTYTSFDDVCVGQVAVDSSAVYIPVNECFSDSTMRVDRYDLATGVVETVLPDLVGNHQLRLNATLEADGWLYLASWSIERFDPITGIQELLPVVEDHSDEYGMLYPTSRLAFGPDGLLYVLEAIDEVIRYDPSDWSKVDTFVESGAGGFVLATDLAFSSRYGLLLLLEGSRNEVLQYDATTGAYLRKFSVDGEVSSTGRMVVAPCNP